MLMEKFRRNDFSVHRSPPKRTGAVGFQLCATHSTQGWGSAAARQPLKQLMVLHSPAARLPLLGGGGEQSSGAGSRQELQPRDGHTALG